MPLHTLCDLTGKKSGIVLHRSEPPMVCDDWTIYQGVPRWFGQEIRSLYEDIPRVLGHWFDDLSEWVEGIDIGTRRPPQRGWVYEMSGITVVAPDEWA